MDTKQNCGRFILVETGFLPVCRGRSPGTDETDHGKKGKGNTMKTIRELNNFSHDELIAAMHNNNALWSELKEIADDFSTVWDLDNLLRNCPRRVDYNIGYPGNYMRLDRYASFEDTLSALDWAKSVAYDFDNGIYDLVDFDNCARYAEVLGDYRKSIKEKDENYMTEYIEKETEKALAAVLGLAVATNEQFEDDYYLADCLLSCELLGDYYEMDGAIYKREYDRKIA